MTLTSSAISTIMACSARSMGIEGEHEMGKRVTRRNGPHSGDGGFLPSIQLTVVHVQFLPTILPYSKVI